MSTIFGLGYFLHLVIFFSQDIFGLLIALVCYYALPVFPTSLTLSLLLSYCYIIAQIFKHKMYGKLFFISIVIMNGKRKIDKKPITQNQIIPDL